MDEYVIFQGIRFQLHHNDFTASVFDSRQTPGDVTIPRSIVYNSQEYIITSIKERSFLNNMHIRSIQFSPLSEVRYIEKYGLSSSSLTRITFPASFEKMEDWSFCSTNISEISVAPGNPYYKSLDKMILIGKSDIKSDNFDSIFFASKSLQTVLIPSYISYFKSHCFSNCDNLKIIEFTSDSNLILIEKNAFTTCSIEQITIPSSARLEEGWCNCISNLTNVIISPESEFYDYLDENKKIIYDKEKLEIVFASRDIKEVNIPYYIKRICESAFANCELLEKVEIPEDSELVSIGKAAFNGTLISEISIPNHVKKIESSTFSECDCLETVILNMNSDLEAIGKYAFIESIIITIIIPKHTKKIGKRAFQYCENLKNVIFCTDCEVEILRDYSFASTLIEKITIPKSVKVIGKRCFDECKMLKSIQFQRDSQLEFIDSEAFSQTIIKSITIPKKVKKMGKRVFFRCISLETVNLEEGSELQSIGKSTFQGSNVDIFGIPEKLTDLQEGWCHGTDSLSTICVSPKNKKFIMINTIILAGKRDENSEYYDTVMFVSHDVDEVTIPSFIKYFNPYSFAVTSYLLRINFTEDSNLLSIGANAFNSSALEQIQIPANVETLEDGWCNFTECLVNVSISPKNKNFMFLPDQNKIMIGKSNIEQDDFDILMFACRDIKNVVVPSYIKRINSSAFFECRHLKNVEISDDSQLQSIGDCCFSYTTVRRITLPKNVVSSGSMTFSFTSLYSFEALAETFSFGEDVFEHTIMETISLPNAHRVHNTKEINTYNTDFNTFSFFVCANAVID
ncbi:hypothetical protein M9Y10_018560 [Tritrichomonas musculus]|uniref:Surface antigen BspA-like n=1 Tax=Tritrichomonas musculus TaxID=1915356 RepID=A0ABR2HNL3_9EUKA